MTTKTEKFLAERSDIKLLVDGLNIEETDLVTAAKEQPRLYLLASRYRVQKMRQRIRVTSEYNALRTRLALEIRRKDTGSKKPKTESYIKELLTKNKDLAEALEVVNRAEEEEELAKRLLDAYDHRGKSIRVVADMIGAEIAMERKMGEYKDLVDLKKQLGKKYPGSP